MSNSYNNDSLASPTFISFSNIASVVNNSSANFYRNSANSNVVLMIPMGTDAFISTLYESGNVFLPINIYNKKKEIDSVIFPNNADAFILKSVTCTHDIVIQYKLNKADGTNFQNRREIRVSLVNQDGITVYDDSIFSNEQPDSGAHGSILIKGSIAHNINDLVKIRINVVQDSKLQDQSNSALTIFLISWDILVLKKF